MADKEKNEVFASPIAALSEANQALAESFSAIQEHNLKYAQSVFESTFTLFKDHVASACSLLQQWENQAQKQQGESKVAESYFEYLRAPLMAYEQALEMVETSSKQSLENFQRATESFQTAIEKGQERWQETLSIAQKSTTRA